MPDAVLYITDMATTDTPLQANTILPSLTVDDLQKSITFYEGLGFGVDERWEDNGVLLGVMLRAGQQLLGLSQDDWKKGRERQKGVAAWNTRAFDVTDPSGFKLSISKE